MTDQQLDKIIHDLSNLIRRERLIFEHVIAAKKNNELGPDLEVVKDLFSTHDEISVKLAELKQGLVTNENS